MPYNFNLTKEATHSRVLYSSIAHAVSLSKYPELSYEQSWDGNNFSIQDGSGVRGTISFTDELIVGAFRSDRMIERNKVEASSYLKGASSQIISYAENETFRYLLDNVNDVVAPSVTTVFFGENEEIYSTDSLDDFKLLTDNLVDFLFLNEKENRNYWIEQYEFSSDEINIIDKIYQSKLVNPMDEIRVPQEIFSNLDFISEEAKEEMKISLTELKISTVESLK